MKTADMSVRNSNRSHRPYAVLMLGALCSGGCGFHLQGAGALPEAVLATYLDTEKPYTEFYGSLRDALRSRGSRIVASRQDASAVLRILEDTTGQRILSVSARNLPREYEIFYSVTFALESEGASVIPPESIVATRSFTYDETRVIGKNAEEAVLRQSLADDLARQVLRRLIGERRPVPTSQT